MDKELLAKIELPRHIGIIMDGNGRWAKREACHAARAIRRAPTPSGASATMRRSLA